MNALWLRRLAISLLLVLAAAGPVLAALDGEVARTWRSRSGRTLSAVLVNDLGESIQLKTLDGKVGTISLASLSDEDRAYVESKRETPAPAAPELPEVLVLFNSETHVAEAVAELLSEHGFKTRIKSVMLLHDAPRMGSVGVVVVTHDAAEWCLTEPAARMIRQSRQRKMPILGMGLAGSRLFSRLELNLGKSPVAFTGDSLILPLADEPLYKEPHAVAGDENNAVRLYDKLTPVYGVFFDAPPAYIKRLGMVIDSRVNYLGLAAEDDRYLMWGFSGSPQIMSEDGRKLFVNMVHFLAKSAPSPEPEPAVREAAPPPAAAQAVEEEVEEPEPEEEPLEGQMAQRPSNAPGIQIYPPGKEPTYPARSINKYQLYLTSKDSRAASMNFDFEVSVRTLDKDVQVAKEASAWYNYRSTSGSVVYQPLIKVLARNKEIPANTLLAIEFFSRPMGSSERERAAVQHVTLPRIEKGSWVTVETPGIALYKSETRSSYSHASASGSELFGLVVGLFDGEQNLLFQESTHQSLKDLASPELLEPTPMGPPPPAVRR